MSTATIPQNATNTSAVPQPDNRSHEKRRTAVGYVRVSTSMQAEDGFAALSFSGSA